VLTLVWTLGSWLAGRRRVPLRPDELAREDYRTQARGMGLRMTEWLRDRLRPGWLRLHRPGDDGPAR